MLTALAIPAALAALLIGMKIGHWLAKEHDALIEVLTEHNCELAKEYNELSEKLNNEQQISGGARSRIAALEKSAVEAHNERQIAIDQHTQRLIEGDRHISDLKAKLKALGDKLIHDERNSKWVADLLREQLAERDRVNETLKARVKKLEDQLHEMDKAYIAKCQDSAERDRAQAAEKVADKPKPIIDEVWKSPL